MRGKVAQELHGHAAPLLGLVVTGQADEIAELSRQGDIVHSVDQMLSTCKDELQCSMPWS